MDFSKKKDSASSLTLHYAGHAELRARAPTHTMALFGYILEFLECVF